MPLFLCSMLVLFGIKSDSDSSLQMFMDTGNISTYKIIIAVDADTAKAITDTRIHLTEKYGIEDSHTGVPQLILAKFMQHESVEDKIKKALERIAKQNAPVELAFKDFGAYPFHTIYLQLINKDPLMKLVKDIRSEAQHLMKWHGNKPGFMSNAHLTIIRKMKKNDYERAWSEYSHKHFLAKTVAHEMLLVRRDKPEKKFSQLASFTFEFLPAPVKQARLFT
jgi:hypothetical protein